MSLFFIVLLACFAWAMGWLLYDATNTQKGIKAGVGVEGNSWITAFYGVKPSLFQCLSIDVPIRIAIAALAFIPTPSHPHVFLGGAVGGLVVAGVKNMQGGRAWKWMMTNPTRGLDSDGFPNPVKGTAPVSHSAWAKFVGFWG
jgi:hypothetical protein